jgi:cellobiose transport system substrate-binding protein
VNVSFSRRHKALGIAAGATAFALLAAGCSSAKTTTSSSAAPSATSQAPITLHVATFNNFGYTDALLKEYTALHPNVTVVQDVAATSNDARTNYFAKLGAGGLADVEAIEVDWLPEVMQYSDLLADLTKGTDVTGRWLDWKTKAATDAKGRLIAYGTDIGPEAVCYNADLFKAAGLPTDPAAVATLLKGGWDTYFKVGEQYTKATGKAWFDSAGGTYQGMINQVAAAYEDPTTGAITATTNADVKKAFDQLTAASATQSAHLSQWSTDWAAGMANGKFATMLCPGWMLGVIKGNAPAITTWNVADVFPGGAGNWGGSYLTVPADGKNVAAATELAAWLTAPEQQLKALAAAGTFPSQIKALDDEASLNAAMDVPGDKGAPSNATFFNSKTLGTIFKNRSQGIVAPFKGKSYFKVNDVMQNALTRVEDGSQDPATSWAQAMTEIKALG